MTDAHDMIRRGDAVKSLRDWQDSLNKQRMPDTAITIGMAADLVAALPSVGVQPASDAALVRAEALEDAAKACDRIAGNTADYAREHRRAAGQCAAMIRALIDTPAPSPDVAAQTFYIDCEFDGHNGPLLSIAMVAADGLSLHLRTDARPVDPWVIQNVMPAIHQHKADQAFFVGQNEVGEMLRAFIGDCQNPTIIADSPVDIGRFCRAISTGSAGGWAPTGYQSMTFKVENVDCYPTDIVGAVQHNAWWDAMALRAALARKGGA